jgi:hypothetical protein
VHIKGINVFIREISVKKIYLILVLMSAFSSLSYGEDFKAQECRKWVDKLGLVNTNLAFLDRFCSTQYANRFYSNQDLVDLGNCFKNNEQQQVISNPVIECTDNNLFINALSSRLDFANCLNFFKTDPTVSQLAAIQFCNDSSIRLNKRDEESLTCYKRFVAGRIPKNSIKVVCDNPVYYQLISNKNYPVCVKYFTNMGFGDIEAYNQCRTYDVLEAVGAGKLQTCQESLRITLTGKNAALFYCLENSNYKNIGNPQYLKCAENLRQLSLKEADILTSCSSSDQQIRIVSSSFNNCIAKVKQNSTIDLEYIKACSSPDERDTILSRDFDKCQATLLPFKLSSSDILGYCKVSLNSEKIRQSNFPSCASFFMTSKKLSFDDSLKLCAKEDLREATTIPEFSKCFETLSLEGKSIMDVALACTNKSLRKAAVSLEFSKCQTDLQSLPIDDESKVIFCLDTDFRSNFKNPNFGECLKTTFSGLYGDYLELFSEYGDYKSKKNTYYSYGFYGPSESELAVNKFLLKESKSNRFIKDCGVLEKIKSAEYNENGIKFIKAFNIHGHQKFEDSTIGGLSALRYDETTDKMYFASDDKGMYGPSRIYKASMTLDGNNSSLNFESYLKLNTYDKHNKYKIDQDTEGLVINRDGDFILSSESVFFTNDNSLKVFSKEGEILSQIDLPEYYDKKEEKAEPVVPLAPTNRNSTIVYPTVTLYNPIPKSTTNNNDSNALRDSDFDKNGKLIDKNNRVTTNNGYVGLSPNTEDNRNNTNTNPAPAPVKVYIPQGLDIDGNHGLEALGISPSKNYIFTGTEQPLMQDKYSIGKAGSSDGFSWGHNINNNKSFRVVRLLTFKDNQGKYTPVRENFYYLEDLSDNGMVEILPLSDTVLLVMERSFNSYSKKVTVLVYKVDLLSGDNILNRDYIDGKEQIKYLEKHLVLNFDDVKPYLNKGFQDIDNIEGMSFGPKTADGKSTVVFCTDNNFRDSQLTQVLAFEIEVNKVLTLKNDKYKLIYDGTSRRDDSYDNRPKPSNTNNGTNNNNGTTTNNNNNNGGNNSTDKKEGFIDQWGSRR